MSGQFPDLEKLVPSFVQKFEIYITSKPDSVLKELYGCERLIRLNNNENCLGPSPCALQEIKAFNPYESSIYPSGDSYFLKNLLAEKTGLPADSFIVGNGANEVIAFAIKAFCEKGDNIITADKTFAVYEWVAEFSGFEAKLIPLLDNGFDPQAMLDRIDSRTKIIFICNPNNPTGSYWNRAVLRRFLDEVDSRTIVVVDEAYAEFVENPDFPDGLSFISEYPNLVVFRTFSKMHALAALRIGFLAGDKKVVDMIRRTSICYSVNRLAQAAAAGALKDADLQIRRTREMVRNARDYVSGELLRIGLPFISGEGNFMMIRIPVSDTSLYRQLMYEGIMVRTMTNFRFPNYIRLTFAELPAMKDFIAALEKVLSQTQKQAEVQG